jgi:hypothetical protein
MPVRRTSSSGTAVVDRLVALLVAAAVTTAALLQIFLGPDLGLADNGDGRRVLCGADLQPPPLSTAFTVVVFDLHPLTDPARGGCNAAASRYSTSQIVLVGAVRVADDLFSGPGTDLRTVGAVVAVLFGLGVGGLYLALSGGRTIRLLTVAGASALLLDVSYLHYFSSPFSEAAGILGALWTTVALARLASRPLGFGPLLAVLLSTTLLVTAKSQLTPLVAIVVLLVGLRIWQHHRARRAEPTAETIPAEDSEDAGPAPRRRWRPGPVLLAWLLIAALLGGSGLQLLYQGPEFHRANLHNLVLFTLAPLSGDAAGTLTELGLDPSLAQYSGTSAFNAGIPVDNRAYQRFREDAGRGAVVEYLAGHPGIALTMLEAGLDQVTQPRTPYLSEIRDPGATAPVLATGRYAPATALLLDLQPYSWPWFPVAWVVLVAWGGVLAVRRGIRGLDLRSWGYALLFCALAAPAQVVIALLGDGYYELAKHELYVSWFSWLALALAVGSLLSALLHRRSPAADPADRTESGPVPARTDRSPADPPAPVLPAGGEETT